MKEFFFCALVLSLAQVPFCGAREGLASAWPASPASSLPQMAEHGGFPPAETSTSAYYTKAAWRAERHRETVADQAPGPGRDSLRVGWHLADPQWYPASTVRAKEFATPRIDYGPTALELGAFARAWSAHPTPRRRGVLRHDVSGRPVDICCRTTAPLVPARRGGRSAPPPTRWRVELRRTYSVVLIHICIYYLYYY
eukprot:SAG22_NODE_5_length_41775_cov_111.520971_10_plen_197_part_00